MLKYEYPEHVYAAKADEAGVTSRNKVSEKSSDELEEEDEDTSEFFSNQEFLRCSSSDPTKPGPSTGNHGVKEGRAYIEGGSRY